MPDRGRINCANRLGRKHDGYRGGDKDDGDHHHQSVGREHQALARHEAVEHLTGHLPGGARGERAG